MQSLQSTVFSSLKWSRRGLEKRIFPCQSRPLRGPKFKLTSFPVQTAFLSTSLQLTWGNIFSAFPLAVSPFVGHRTASCAPMKVTLEELLLTVLGSRVAWWTTRQSSPLILAVQVRVGWESLLKVRARRRSIVVIMETGLAPSPISPRKWATTQSTLPSTTNIFRALRSKLSSLQRLTSTILECPEMELCHTVHTVLCGYVEWNNACFVGFLK